MLVKKKSSGNIFWYRQSSQLCGSLGCQFQLEAEEKRSVVSVDISLRNSFVVRSVCLFRRKWTREATLMYLPRVPRRLSFVKVCARSLALRHQSLTFCARLFAKPCEKRSAWGVDCWLMYYLAGRYPSMLNFAVSIVFFVYRSLCPLP